MSLRKYVFDANNACKAVFRDGFGLFYGQIFGVQSIDRSRLLFEVMIQYYDFRFGVAYRRNSAIYLSARSFVVFIRLAYFVTDK